MILWLESAFATANSRYKIDTALSKIGLKSKVQFFRLEQRVPNLQTQKLSPKTGKPLKAKTFDDTKRPQVEASLDGMIARLGIKMLVVQDLSMLWFITGDDSYSLDKCRGSIYFYKDIPCLVFNASNVYDQRIVPHGPFVLLHDLQKLERWYKGKQRHEPKFTYSVARTPADLIKAEKFLHNCEIISTDIETKAMSMTCQGYTGLNAKGEMHTWVVPFFNPTKEGNCHWEDEDDEIHALKTVQRINANPVPKALQNGYYDACYLVNYRCPLKNYSIDTMLIAHSIWAELPKTLNFLASLFVDYYRYWKDENKDNKEADEKLAASSEGIERYYRYNGLDCYYTMLLARFMTQACAAIDWSVRNYCEVTMLQLGPGLAGSMRGMAVNADRHTLLNEIWERDIKKNLERCRTIADDSEFNPNSDPQFASFLYDVLGAHEIKGKGRHAPKKRSTDKKVLKLVAAQHPLFARAVRTIQDYKEACNIVSKYGLRKPRQNAAGVYKITGLKLLHGRFYYSLWAAGTDTSRFSSKDSNFRVGTNVQNIPEVLRILFSADEGHVFLEFDYSQSDAYYVAFTSEDEKFINTMYGVNAGKDSHLTHTEHFFKVPYEESLARKLKKDPFITDPQTGLRPLTKRIVHGANFLMAGFTLFMTMGVDAVNAAALALGRNDVVMGGQPVKVKFCQELLNSYGTELYPDLKEWQTQLPGECWKNGSKLTTAYGRTRIFFGDILRDSGVQRKMASFIGQGGTAGNVNRSLIEYYFNSGLDGDGCYFVTQTHDSALFMVKLDRCHEIAKKLLTIMEKPVTVKGREFTVPVEGKIGLSWGNMIDYSPDVTVDALLKNEQKIDQKLLERATA